MIKENVQTKLKNTSAKKSNFEDTLKITKERRDLQRKLERVQITSKKYGQKIHQLDVVSFTFDLKFIKLKMKLSFVPLMYCNSDDYLI